MAVAWWRVRRLPWKKILLTVGSLFLLTVIVTVLAARRECVTMPPVPTVPTDGSGSLLEERYRRAEDNTYLTFPEWYIVYSGDEYAKELKSGRPSGFRYFAAAGQYWCGYGRVHALTKGRYTFNGGYHLMLGVIGVSFTAEEMMKGAYENTVGRVFEWLSFGQISAEDEYAQQVAEDYGTFMHTTPWFEFPFGKKLLGLWQLEPFGDAPLRKVERRVVLTLEYAVKSVYAFLMRAASGSVYGTEDLTVRLVTSAVSSGSGVTVVETLKDGHQVIEIPRYEAFTKTVLSLARQGIGFIEIAGNDEILVTAMVPKGELVDLPEAVPVLAMRVLIDTDRMRMGWRVPVANLTAVINALDGQGIEIEHLYDY
jgi:hypothetical protein